ncbi:hypothetical protein [Streptomyces oceani]|uniref:hypothetical protein n=1 Tax=Streptomyces oceani TaxID=1075402 RepID=UPI001FCD5D5E|nr:hypothetical protein [Streptomyces oceani]
MSLFHHDHPLLGHLVHDTLHDLTGRLTAVCPEVNPAASRTLTAIPGDGPPVAWLRPPQGGGQEWTTPLDHIREPKP